MRLACLARLHVRFPVHGVFGKRQELKEQVAAEEFLRLAEPPAHDKWAYNSDIAEVYARGSKRMLDEFSDRVVEQLQRVLRPIAVNSDQGPDILNRLFFLRSLKPATPRRPRAMVRTATGRVESGVWVVDAEVSVLPPPLMAGDFDSDLVGGALRRHAEDGENGRDRDPGQDHRRDQRPRELEPRVAVDLLGLV